MDKLQRWTVRFGRGLAVVAMAGTLGMASPAHAALGDQRWICDDFVKVATVLGQGFLFEGASAFEFRGRRFTMVQEDGSVRSGRFRVKASRIQFTPNRGTLNLVVRETADLLEQGFLDFGSVADLRLRLENSTFLAVLGPDGNSFGFRARYRIRVTGTVDGVAVSTRFVLNETATCRPEILLPLLDVTVPFNP